jgi:hypothetical protein
MRRFNFLSAILGLGDNFFQSVVQLLVFVLKMISNFISTTLVIVTQLNFTDLLPWLSCANLTKVKLACDRCFRLLVSHADDGSSLLDKARIVEKAFLSALEKAIVKKGILTLLCFNDLVTDGHVAH